MSLLVLTALLSFSFWLYHRQSRIPPIVAELDGSAPQSAPRATPAHAAAARLIRLAPEGFAVMSPPEHFDADDLYEKINGRAELYLPAGFTGLDCIRFSSRRESEAWFEIFIYDMAAPLRAFSVYSAQRREDAVPSDITDFAYATDNALYFAHGRYYVEMIGTTSSDALRTAMLDCAQRFIADTTEHAGRVEELTLFPPEHLVPDSVVLLISDGFGFDLFDYLFTAMYELNDTTVQAFLTARASPGEAVALAAAYCEFLIDNGGVFEDFSVGIPGARMYNLFGTYELVFSSGKIVAGVHEADSPEAAAKTASALHRRMTRKRP